jgi:hypothetical protein
MGASRNRRHILVLQPPTAERYKPYGRKIDTKKPEPPTNRREHGTALQHALKAAAIEAIERRERAGIEVR